MAISSSGPQYPIRERRHLGGVMEFDGESWTHHKPPVVLYSTYGIGQTRTASSGWGVPPCSVLETSCHLRQQFRRSFPRPTTKSSTQTRLSISGWGTGDMGFFTLTGRIGEGSMYGTVWPTTEFKVPFKPMTAVSGSAQPKKPVASTGEPGPRTLCPEIWVPVSSSSLVTERSGSTRARKPGIPGGSLDTRPKNRTTG